MPGVPILFSASVDHTDVPSTQHHEFRWLAGVDLRSKRMSGGTLNKHLYLFNVLNAKNQEFQVKIL